MRFIIFLIMSVKHLEGFIPLVFITNRSSLMTNNVWNPCATHSGQTEMYPLCFALVIILKFCPDQYRIIIFCPCVGGKLYILLIYK